MTYTLYVLYTDVRFHHFNNYLLRYKKLFRILSAYGIQLVNTVSHNSININLRVSHMYMLELDEHLGSL